jgi:hypothetical protein
VRKKKLSKMLLVSQAYKTRLTEAGRKLWNIFLQETLPWAQCHAVRKTLPFPVSPRKKQVIYTFITSVFSS